MIKLPLLANSAGAAVSFLGAASTTTASTPTQELRASLKHCCLSQVFRCSALQSAQAVTLLHHRFHLTLKV